MSEAHMKKKLIRRAVINAIVLAVIGGASYGTMYFADQYVEDAKKATSSLRRDENKIRDLEEKYGIYESSYNEFSTLMEKMDAGTYELNIEETKELLNRMRQTHRINNLTVKISPKTVLDSNLNNQKGYEPVQREVTLTFSAMSDVHMFRFINDIREKLTGIKNFTKVTFKKERTISDDLLKDVSKGATPSLVSADITFSWMGIQSLSDEEGQK